MATGGGRTAAGRTDAKRRRIAISAQDGRSLVRECLPLARSLIDAGHMVLCLAPKITDTDDLTLTHAGARVEEIDLVANRYALMPERQITRRISSRLSEWGADSVIARGDEVMALVTLAAHKAHLSRIIAVHEGLEDRHEEAHDAALGAASARLMKAFNAATDVLCLNYDHAAALELSGLLPQRISPVVLPWSGVDLDEFAVAPLPPINKGLTFLMIGDLSRAHGVLDFCEAAVIVTARAAQTTFLLAGPSSTAADSIALEELARYRDVVTYLGDGEDRADLIGKCHVFVCPAHAQTVPEPALEAMAMGRALVVTDTPGCRELVDERVNGCLAPPANAAALAVAMQSYLKRPDLIAAMARASRQKAGRRFDRRLVMAAMFDLLGIERAHMGQV